MSAPVDAVVALLRQGYHADDAVEIAARLCPPTSETRQGEVSAVTAVPLSGQRSPGGVAPAASPGDLTPSP